MIAWHSPKQEPSEGTTILCLCEGQLLMMGQTFHDALGQMFVDCDDIQIRPFFKLEGWIPTQELLELPRS